LIYASHGTAQLTPIDLGHVTARHPAWLHNFTSRTLRAKPQSDGFPFSPRVSWTARTPGEAPGTYRTLRYGVCVSFFCLRREVLMRGKLGLFVVAIAAALLVAGESQSQAGRRSRGCSSCAAAPSCASCGTTCEAPAAEAAAATQQAPPAPVATDAEKEPSTPAVAAAPVEPVRFASRRARRRARR
jgi:hypothetical protein